MNKEERLQKYPTDPSLINWEEVNRECYGKKGKRQSDIANELGVSCSRVSVEFRKLKHPFVINNYVDYTVFDKWSEESAYWLGFIAADGNLSSSRFRLYVALQVGDIEHIKKLKGFLKTVAPIRKHKTITKKGNTSDVRYLAVTNRYLYEKLVGLGLVPRKSFLEQDFTLGIPKEFLLPFSFGYFDGDGCISTRRDNKRASVFFAGRSVFLKSLRTFFIKRGYAPSPVYIKKDICSLDISNIRGVYRFCKDYIDYSSKLPLLVRKLEHINDVYQNLTELGATVDNGISRGTSKYKGVFWRSSRNRWVAWTPTREGKRTYLGCFEKEDEAGSVASVYWEEDGSECL